MTMGAKIFFALKRLLFPLTAFDASRTSTCGTGGCSMNTGIFLTSTGIDSNASRCPTTSRQKSKDMSQLTLFLPIMAENSSHSFSSRDGRISDHASSSERCNLRISAGGSPLPRTRLVYTLLLRHNETHCGYFRLVPLTVLEPSLSASTSKEIAFASQVDRSNDSRNSKAQGLLHSSPMGRERRWCRPAIQILMSLG